MAVYNQWDRVAQQHLARLAQLQAASRHQLRQVSEQQASQAALAEAALEAYLVYRLPRQVSEEVSVVHQR